MSLRDTAFAQAISEGAKKMGEGMKEVGETGTEAQETASKYLDPTTSAYDLLGRYGGTRYGSTAERLAATQLNKGS